MERLGQAHTNKLLAGAILASGFEMMDDVKEGERWVGVCRYVCRCVVMKVVSGLVWLVYANRPIERVLESWSSYTNAARLKITLKRPLSKQKDCRAVRVT